MELVLIWKALVQYGVLGIICFLEGWAIVRLWRENNALRDRYEVKAEKSADKIAALSARANAAADILEQRRRAHRTTDVEPLHR
jgi:hypothetical protein